MHRFTKKCIPSVVLIILLLPACATLPLYETSSSAGTNGVVVASHPVAADIGLEALKRGGNAVDAAVATGLALGVVDQFNSGIGGGGFIVIRMADGTVYTIDGREAAPAAASRDMYICDGKYEPTLSKVGPLAVGVPGILAAYEKALQLGGTQSLGSLIEPSIAAAENGFELDESYISRYEDAVDALRENPTSARIYFHDDGTPLEAGDVLRQPDLARTYRNIRDGGTDYFYRGEFASTLADYMAREGGLITRQDMQNYRALLREPVTGSFRGCEIIGMAPPSSGGVHVLQLLNMVEASGVLEGKTGWDTDSVYWVSRFMSKAFQDRAAYLGDPDFYPVPVERLTSKRYAEESLKAMDYPELSPKPMPTTDSRAAVSQSVVPVWGQSRIHAAKYSRRNSWDSPEHDRGTDTSSSERKPDIRSAGLTSHTTNLCVIDRWGNAAAINQTVNLTYGAKVTLPGTGVILNDQMDDFSAQPGVPNAFGLIGSEANSIAPGKRPLSSMAPTIVVKDGKPVLILGGAGGPVIITAVFETIVDVLDFGRELAEAQAQPRFHQQYRPDVILVEDAIPFSSRLGLFLKTRHPVVRSSGAIGDSLGRVNAIAWSDSEQAYVGVADPRSRGGVATY